MLAKFLLISVFFYQNAKNINTDYKFFKLNRKYYLSIFNKKDISPYSHF